MLQPNPGLESQAKPAPPPGARRASWPRLRLLAAAAALTAIALALYLEKQTAPACARLLPESQAILYFNLRPLRVATHFDQRPVPHDPDYQHFIDATGINFERDLDEAAFALHRSPDPLGPNGPVAFSEVFSGHFDPKRLVLYLEGVAPARETYAGHTIYALPSAGRTVRVALLGKGLVAVSNTPTSEQIHSIVDHQRTPWLSLSPGPTLLAEHYKELPLLSLAWGIGQIGLPFTDHGELRLLGLTLPFRLDTTFLASLRWTGALRLRVEQIAPSEAAAAAAANSLRGLVSLGRIAENNLPGPLADENARALLNSATVVSYADRAVLTATLPTQFFDKLMAAPEAASSSGVSRPVH